MFLLDLIQRLESAQVNYALVGGYAVALHGAVRGTVDIDLVISLNKENLVAAERALVALGLVSRIPISGADVFSFREEYIKKRNLIGWNFYSPKDPSQLVDIIITHDLKNLSTVTKVIGKKHVTIVAIDDLIKMKKQSGRPQDLLDIEALERIKK